MITRYTGRITHVARDGNYAFITCEDLPKTVFAHVKQIRGAGRPVFTVLDRVTFEVRETPKGLSADNVIINVSNTQHPTTL